VLELLQQLQHKKKIDICKDNGADEGFVYPSGNLDRDQQKELSNKIKELTGGMGPNVIYDPVGGTYAEPCLRSIAWDGKISCNWLCSRS
jgi:NADPH2:quinone reductase